MSWSCCTRCNAEAPLPLVNGLCPTCAGDNVKIDKCESCGSDDGVYALCTLCRAQPPSEGVATLSQVLQREQMHKLESENRQLRHTVESLKGQIAALQPGAKADALRIRAKQAEEKAIQMYQGHQQLFYKLEQALRTIERLRKEQKMRP